MLQLLAANRRLPIYSIRLFKHIQTLSLTNPLKSRLLRHSLPLHTEHPVTQHGLLPMSLSAIGMQLRCAGRLTTGRHAAVVPMFSDPSTKRAAGGGGRVAAGAEGGAEGFSKGC